MRSSLLVLSLLSSALIQDAYQRATVAFQRGYFIEVLSLLAELPEQEADRPAPHNLRALALAELGRYGEALAANKRARELDPSNINYVYNRGLILIAKEDFQQAERVFRDAIDRFPQSSRLYQGLGETLYRLTRFKEAESWLREAVQADPTNGPAHIALARLFYALGDREDYGSAASKAIQLDPENYLACYYYGLWLLEVQGKFSEGSNYIGKSIELYPRFVDGLKAWGGVLSRQGRWDEAARTYEKAVALDLRNAQLYYLLAIAYHKLGEQGKAERAVEEYRRLAKP
ncbi:MAG TPA: tetratricopeptide repeat protein [Acidobacteriota bacterium]|jgi:tetratricopeptide (TPR) repeat protein